MENSKRVTSIFIAVALLALAALALSVDRQAARKTDIAAEQDISVTATADELPVHSQPAER
jgi:regulatory protein YycI of two-component signal transduction system YycFG